ncbi:acyltransferase [Salmonella enterica subsp. enterica serovar Techimani]|nr:acyltransferase [Salmonella enterica subsp. enterica serovar Ank]EJN2805514.1 acyltransferase [Salmonella enterica]EJN2870962.1 acyltransferase [Salmonella enterica subsp. enterica serovar Techimani]EFX3900736.1 acyltransferase [Salmonella enterica subsp. enterica serovar Ank]EHY9923545.1 acyltransferase [Salmonella enterica subsp. enterica serovar Ank]
MKHIQQVDGLRAFSVLGVMLYHLGIPGFGMGWLGVSFFFVLSGFLITRILIETKESENFFSNFYIRRSLRIFPLYYLYILVVFIYCSCLGIQGTQNWLYYIFYVQNYTMAWNNFLYVPGQEFGHTWSLAVEEQFYLLWPLVMFFCNKKWIFISAIILSCVAITSRFYLAEYTSIVSFAPLFSAMDTLLIGAIIAVISVNQNVMKVISCSLLAVGLFWFIAVVKFGVLIYGWHTGPEIANQSLYLSSNMLFAGVIGIIASGVFKAKFLTIAPLIYLGKISYGLYLWHPFAIQIVDSLQYRGHFLWVTGPMVDVSKLALTVAISSISFKYFELPFLKLKDHFTKRA